MDKTWFLVPSVDREATVKWCSERNNGQMVVICMSTSSAEEGRRALKAAGVERGTGNARKMLAKIAAARKPAIVTGPYIARPGTQPRSTAGILPRCGDHL